MSTRKTIPHKVGAERVAQPSGARTAAPAADENKLSVLAQIPDLDAPLAADEPAQIDDGPDGRIIGQGISNYLVMGVGLALVLIAVLPFVLNKKGTQKPVVNELPAWPPGGAVTKGQPTTPMAVPAPTVSYEASRVVPAATPAYLTPQQAASGANRPLALGDPAWPTAAAPHRVPPPRDPGLATAAEYRATDPPGARPASPVLQADAPGDPAAIYRGGVNGGRRRRSGRFPHRSARRLPRRLSW